jgi:hypothetical protein
MLIQEQIADWFNNEDFQGRKHVIEEIKSLIEGLEEQLENTCSQCMECFEDCDCTRDSG